MPGPNRGAELKICHPLLRCRDAGSTCIGNPRPQVRNTSQSSPRCLNHARIGGGVRHPNLDHRFFLVCARLAERGDPFERLKAIRTADSFLLSTFAMADTLSPAEAR